MDMISIISIILQVIGGATVLLRIVAPITKNKTDDKILKIFNKILEAVSLNMKEGTVTVKVKR